jgi:hypothetical protein
MAHSLGLTVIAEGVETPEHLQFLKKIGCDEDQGYLHIRPIHAEDFERLLRQPVPCPSAVEAVQEKAAALADREEPHLDSPAPFASLVYRTECAPAVAEPPVE